MPGNLLRPVVQETTPSLIARQLRRAIGDGELAPGQQLNEMELSRSLGVSRGPLREAMQRLTQEGLLLSVRNRGVFVIEVTDDDVRDLYLARNAVERAAAARVIAGDPEAGANRLLEKVDEMSAAIDRGDTAALTETDVAFHALLVELSESPRLIRMHDTLMVETRMCMTALETRYASHSFRLEEHRDITEAIRDADEARVDRLLLEHMRDAVMRLTTDDA
ncbi:GntR family transcriptional regulator [Kocuria sp.]|uniref:GntR family transcriptional regulator n=1 Tax=Kocuria sp. TaxID=1871328 RepID=UPI0026DFB941|nr:GntR family transcriptional regulator [Kocuria sp.]MDO5366506.1 GntR family transcriptional regulator [Kocuria sp.]